MLGRLKMKLSWWWFLLNFYLIHPVFFHLRRFYYTLRWNSIEVNDCELIGRRPKGVLYKGPISMVPPVLQERFKLHQLLAGRIYHLTQPKSYVRKVRGGRNVLVIHEEAVSNRCQGGHALHDPKSLDASNN